MIRITYSCSFFLSFKKSNDAENVHLFTPLFYFLHHVVLFAIISALFVAA